MKQNNEGMEMFPEIQPKRVVQWWIVDLGIPVSLLQPFTFKKLRNE